MRSEATSTDRDGIGDCERERTFRADGGGPLPKKGLYVSSVPQGGWAGPIGYGIGKANKGVGVRVRPQPPIGAPSAD